MWGRKKKKEEEEEDSEEDHSEEHSNDGDSEKAKKSDESRNGRSMRVAYPSFLATIKVMMLVLKIGDDEKTGYDPLVRATLKRKHWSRALGS